MHHVSDQINVFFPVVDKDLALVRKKERKKERNQIKNEEK